MPLVREYEESKAFCTQSERRLSFPRFGGEKALRGFSQLAALKHFAFNADAYPAAVMKFKHSSGSKSPQMSASAPNRASKPLTSICQRCALSLVNAFGLGLQNAASGAEGLEVILMQRAIG